MNLLPVFLKTKLEASFYLVYRVYFINIDTNLKKNLRQVITDNRETSWIIM
jgi:hypothetical protein